MRQVSFGNRRKEGRGKPGGELNLTLIFYEYDPRSCNDECNLGLCCKNYYYAGVLDG